MADDGLLLNFDVSTVAVTKRPKVTGGRWRDRLKVRKGGAPDRKRASRGQADNANLVQLGQRPAPPPASSRDDEHRHASKKQRIEGPNDSSRSLTGGRSNAKEVVSSLFTSNPKPVSAPVPEDREDGPASKPSNAPLPEGAANFTSLGLSPTLATHLLSKLELKAPTAIQKATISQLLEEDCDAFIQAETGSGKTLAYLLPIVQRLMALSKKQEGQVHRDSGLFAIIMAPTRELCRQIQAVVDSLLHCAHWLVSGSVTGGERKKSEKARLRKGLNILVATPGRLADHLQNTSVLDVSNVRWLVLDEGDRLMELGFEQEIKGIVEALEKRNKDAGAGAVPQQTSIEGLPRRRITILCSATMKMSVQRLGEVSLKDAVHIHASDPKAKEGDTKQANFTAPAQMKQSYIIVPAKQRLVTLAALLRKEFARRGSVMKAIVFMSCADSVDFHFELLKRGAEKQKDPDVEPRQTASPPPSSPEPVKAKPRQRQVPSSDPAIGPITSSSAPMLSSSANSGLEIFRLHGSLAQPVRTSTLRGFSRTSNPAVLVCTDVASRGLDLPSIDLVIEYDPAFSAEDHLHRVGRTARAGKDGRAILFLMPGTEESYVELLEKESHIEEGGKRKLIRLEADEILKRGFAEEPITAQAQASANTKTFTPTAGSNKAWEQRATEWQLEAERWALPTENRRIHGMAEKAFKSSVAAYATHIKPERHMFDVSGLHLGHLAKSFALRDRPSDFGRAPSLSKKRDRNSRSFVAGKSNGNAAMDVDDDAVRRGGEVDGDVMAKMRKLAKAREADQAGEFNFG